MYNLKVKRQAAGLSQSELAEVSGVPAGLIRKYEAEADSAHRDINKAAAITVYKLALALKCEVADILELDSDEGDM